MNRIDRLTGMILLLQGQRVITAEQIAEHFEISVRTVYRDLSALGEAGVPIIAEAGVGYSLMRGYHMPPVMFTEEEAAALFMSGEVTEQVADDSLKQSLRSALLKIKSVLPQEKKDYLSRLRNAIGVWFRRGGSEDRKLSLMPIQDAVVRRHCLALRYDAASKGKITTRIVEPLGLVFYSRQWHLIAWCRLRKAFRDFRLDRFAGWEVMAECYHGHADFSVKAFLQEKIDGDELAPATIRVSREVLDRFRSEMPCSSLDERIQPDGSVEVEILTCSMSWLSSWLLGYGTLVEAIEPQELRDLLRDAAMAVAARYSEDLVPM
jgi:predicted DNA-binding transcriptional regulator YafY